MTAFAFTPIGSDSFQRANESPLNPANWEIYSTANGGSILEIINDVCVQINNPEVAGVELFTTVPPNDQFAGCTIAALGLLIEVLLRATLGTNFYFLEALPTETLVRLSSPSTALATYPGACNVGDVLLFAAIGTTLYAFKNGTQAGAVTDSTLSSGLTGAGVLYSSVYTDTGITNFVMGQASTAPSGQAAPTIPNGLDKGHVYDQVLYYGTLQGWGGRTGNITPDATLGDTPFPVAHKGEVPSARAHIDDFTFTPVNGQRVQFYMVRDSAGDKNAVAIAPL